MRRLILEGGAAASAQRTPFALSPLRAVAAPDGLFRSLRLRVPDLLEDLAHARAQEVARLGVGVAVATSSARGLA